MTYLGKYRSSFPVARGKCTKKKMKKCLWIVDTFILYKPAESGQGLSCQADAADAADP